MSLSLSYKVFSAEQVRRLEPEAARLSGCDMFSLMQRAGQAAYELMRKQWPQASNILVLTGNGNNAGDGYVLAGLCRQDGLTVTVAAAQPQKVLTGDALTAQQQWVNAGGQLEDCQDVAFGDFDIIVDALLGSGLCGELKTPFEQIIQAVNRAPQKVLSIDIPSGIQADTGAALGCAVQAAHTITFVGIKPGLTTAAGRQACGKLHFASLGVGAAFESLADSEVSLTAFCRLAGMSARAANSHKGDYGRLLCIGGNQGMAGAIRLSGEAALRAGTGLVKIYCHRQSVLPVSSGRPELMVTAEGLSQALDWASCIVMGPGMGQDQWSHDSYQQVKTYLTEQPKPLLLDADGLHLLNQSGIPKGLAQLVITPHPGEAARLLQSGIPEIENDRFTAIRALAAKLQAVVLLKGAGTLIDDQQHCYVVEDGNPGMATAGMGDVLSGVIGALLAQGLAPTEATLFGACLHSAAADLLARSEGQRGMLASDLFPLIRQLINQ